MVEQELMRMCVVEKVVAIGFLNEMHVADLDRPILKGLLVGENVRCRKCCCRRKEEGCRSVAIGFLTGTHVADLDHPIVELEVMRMCAVESAVANEKERECRFVAIGFLNGTHVAISTALSSRACLSIQS